MMSCELQKGQAKQRAIQMLQHGSGSKLKAFSRESPSAYLRRILPDIAGQKRTRAFAFGSQKIEDEINNYDVKKVNAIRSNDVDMMRALLEEGESFDACNNNGETLLHLACRRSNVETVRFLVLEARVKVDVQDDMGRTVLHDVCWRPRPHIQMVEHLINLVSPELFLLEDARGHTCLDYCRQSDWAEWKTFLHRNANVLKRRSQIVRSASFTLQRSTNAMKHNSQMRKSISFARTMG